MVNGNFLKHWKVSKYYQTDCLKNFQKQGMCNDAVDVDPWQLADVSDYLKTQKMCDDVVKRDSCSAQFVPDWFVTQEQLEIWADDDGYYDEDELVEWYSRYKKRTDQKALIKEELLPMVWHPSRY